MRLYKFRGQYILKNRKIAKKIVDYAKVSKDDTILEVGCGTGVLTEFLLKSSSKVYGIEIDDRFIEILRKKFYNEINDGRFFIIHGDALKVDFPEFTKFVSNIPYSISSPLTFKFLKYYKMGVVMYQKEFAERLVSKSGKSYGRISVIARAFATPKLVRYVGKENFYPIPKVDSAIVMFKPNPEIRVKDFNVFYRFVTLSFTKRRKKMINIFKFWKKNFGYIPEYIIEKYGNLRAEDISPEEFAEISNSLFNSIYKKF